MKKVITEAVLKLLMVRDCYIQYVKAANLLPLSTEELLALNPPCRLPLSTLTYDEHTQCVRIKDKLVDGIVNGTEVIDKRTSLDHPANKSSKVTLIEVSIKRTTNGWEAEYSTGAPRCGKWVAIDGQVILKNQYGGILTVTANDGVQTETLTHGSSRTIVSHRNGALLKETSVDIYAGAVKELYHQPDGIFTEKFYFADSSLERKVEFDSHGFPWKVYDRVKGTDDYTLTSVLDNVYDHQGRLVTARQSTVSKVPMFVVDFKPVLELRDVELDCV